MALKRISDYAAATLDGTELLELETSAGLSKNCTTQDIANLSGAQPSAVVALPIATGVVDIDLAGGSARNFTLALTENVTSITFSNLPASGFVAEIDVEITQDATGSRTVALPAAFKALGGSDTAVASAANTVTVLSAKTWDQGTTWRYAMQESA